MKKQIVGCSENAHEHGDLRAEYKLLNWAKLVPNDQGIIYWHIANFTSKMDKYKILFAFQTCFIKWQSAFDAIEPVGRVIEFKPTDNWNEAHIKLYFVSPGLKSQTITLATGEEKIINNAFPFDGPLGVLAHRLHNSFDLYFDDSESWSEIHKFEKVGEKFVAFVQLWQVAMHELGHMFDIGHASDKKALMYPTYDGQHIDITKDDLSGLAAAWSKTKQETKAKIPALMPTVAITDPRVTHLQGKLPVGKGTYRKRDISQIEQFILHHTADNGTPESIAKFHTKPISKGGREWPGIAYPFLIDKTGAIFQCHDIDVVSYHVENQNTKSLGICLIGNFEKAVPTTEQIDSLKWLLAALRGIVGELPLYGHREKGKTLCPGKNLYHFLKTKDVS